MSVENLIKNLSYYLDSRQPKSHDVYAEISAALRAGEQMRGQFALPDQSKDFPGMIAAIDFFEACKAWDKTVQEVTLK